MAKRKLMTIDDLVKFCREQNFTKFSSKESGYKLAVQVPTTFEIDENVDDAHRGMLKLKFRIFHTGLNRNGSFVSEDAAKDAMPTIKNRPILAAIHQLDDGEWDFESHNFEVVKNEETGKDEIIYIEKQVGSFDESEPFFEYDEELDKTFVCSYGYIPEEYTMAADIIRRKNGTKNSCELSIDELSFNAKESYLSLDKFYVAASTLLGSKKDGTEIGEGMLGSRADIADFSEQNNSMQFDINEELLNEIKKLNENLSHFSINNHERKEEQFVETNKEFEEVVEETVETVEETVVETEEVIETASEDATEESTEEVVTEETSEETTEESTEETPDVVVEESVEETVEEVVETTETPEVTEEFVEDGTDDDEDDAEDDKENFSKTFELSHDDVKCSLYQLLAPYEEANNDWYWIVEVFDNHFVYQGCMGNYFGQKYVKTENDSVAFDGEPYALYSEFLTESERAALTEMRSNYASLVQFKADTENAELHAQREAILYDAKYSVLAEKDENDAYKNEAYAKLVSEMDNYSLTDLEKELKSVFADHITNGGQFAYAGETEKPTVTKKLFANSTSKKSSRYGNLFNK